MKRNAGLTNGSLPESWAEVSVGDVIAEAQYGLSIAMQPEGRYPILRMAAIQDGSVLLDDLKYVDLPEDVAAQYLLRHGDILFNRTNSQELVGKVGVYRSSTPAVFASYLIRLKANAEAADTYFLGRLLDSYPVQCRIRRYATPGVQQVNINTSNLQRVRVALPWGQNGLEEQQEIARILDAADAAIECSRDAIAKARRLRDGLLQRLLTAGIDGEGQIRNLKVGRRLFKEAAFGRIPKEWTTKSLASVAQVNRGKFTPRPRNDPRYYGGPYPFIQTGDITRNRGRVIHDFTQTLNELGAEVSRGFPVGTIAVTIAANIADTAVLGIPMYFPDSIVGVVVEKPHNGRFVELCIRQAKPRLEAEAPQSAQKNINLEDLRHLVIPVPDPEEQDRIASVYDTADRLVQAHERCLEKYERLKRGLMQDLLAGRVRVNGGSR